MSILSWLKTVTTGDPSADVIAAQPMHFAAGEETFQGLNMKDALDAHSSWVNRLEGKINGSNSEALDVVAVACDDKCKLGQWIHGSAGKSFGHLQEFNDLKKVHADFHLTAGEVLSNVTSGAAQEARNALKQVRFKSGGVQLALVRLYSQVQ